MYTAETMQLAVKFCKNIVIANETTLHQETK